jgi:glycosyltransferase involved in cell wall biosynthesis
MQLSIIIPTLNEEKYVPKLLSDLRAQTFQDFEIIIVDGGSNDGTVRTVKQNYPKAHVIETGRGFSLARNLGGDKASADTLLFLDADVRIETHFIEQLLQNAGHMEGKLINTVYKADSDRLVDKLGTYLIITYGRLFSRTKRPICNGYCILIDKRLHQAVGGFDEKLLHAEDHDYARRVIATGGRFQTLKNPYFLVSVRRFDHVGRWRLLKRYMRSELHRFRHGGNVKHDHVGYTGDHDTLPR